MRTQTYYSFKYLLSNPAEMITNARFRMFCINASFVAASMQPASSLHLDCMLTAWWLHGNCTSQNKGNRYTIYYHYHFDLFDLGKRHDFNFFVDTYYQHENAFYKHDPLYQSDYITQREVSHTFGLTTGISKSLKEVRGLRFEGGFGIGSQMLTDDTKYRKDAVIMYTTEKTSQIAIRVELGMHLTLF